MAQVRYVIKLSPTAKIQLADIRNTKTREKIGKKIDTLTSDPEKRGKELHENLAGYRRLVAAGRYRVIYAVDMIPPGVEKQVQPPTVDVAVNVVCIGIRKQGDHKHDVYEIAKKLLAAGKLRDV